MFHAAREYLTPVLTASAYAEKGQLTPAEFTSTGDYLTRTAATWAWLGGDASKARTYLPAGKQYLLTRRVPCHRRVRALEAGADAAVASERLVSADDVGAGGGGGGGGVRDWVEPSMAAFGTRPDDGAGGDADADIVCSAPAAGGAGGVAAAPPAAAPAPAPAPAVPAAAAAAAAAAGSDEDDEYADMSSFVGSSNLVRVDAAAAAVGSAATGGAAAAAAGGAGSSGGGDNVLRTRSYDVSITYDNYYRTPRVYLKGYDEDGAPLSAEAMLEDVMQDYANRTATIETHPHAPEAGPHISIHPCRHAQAMKRILDALTAAGAPVPPVEHYLFIFLKFIASIVPTIEYDYTVPVKVASAAPAAAPGV